MNGKKRTHRHCIGWHKYATPYQSTVYFWDQHLSFQIEIHARAHTHILHTYYQIFFAFANLKCASVLWVCEYGVRYLEVNPKNVFSEHFREAERKREMKSRKKLKKINTQQNVIIIPWLDFYIIHIYLFFVVCVFERWWWVVIVCVYVELWITYAKAVGLQNDGTRVWFFFLYSFIFFFLFLFVRGCFDRCCCWWG